MMRVGDIVVLENGVLRQGVRDADTEDSHGFGVVLDREQPLCLEEPTGTRVRFEDEGTRWARGTIDSPAARALLTVASLREETRAVICGECGGALVFPDAITGECPDCGAVYP